MSTAITQPPAIGQLEWLTPLIRRVLAPNPSVMTHWGTNSYIIGDGGACAVIDPGPQDRRHHAALLAALSPGEYISDILVTHRHIDHSGLAYPLAKDTRVRLWAFDAPSPQAPPAWVKPHLSPNLHNAIDHDFTPDAILQDGQRLVSAHWTLTAHHTPGHLADHICLSLEDWLFTGDHVMAWSSSMIALPYGDMGSYMAGLARLSGQGWQQFLPAHGPLCSEPEKRIFELLTHRRARETQILAALSLQPHRLSDLVTRCYDTTPPYLHKAAAQNILALLVDLHKKQQVSPLFPHNPNSTFQRTY